MKSLHIQFGENVGVKTLQSLGESAALPVGEGGHSLRLLPQVSWSAPSTTVLLLSPGDRSPLVQQLHLERKLDEQGRIGLQTRQGRNRKSRTPNKTRQDARDSRQDRILETTYNRQDKTRMPGTPDHCKSLTGVKTTDTLTKTMFTPVRILTDAFSAHHAPGRTPLLGKDRKCIQLIRLMVLGQ